MRQEQLDEAKFLRTLSSAEAASWILKKSPPSEIRNILFPYSIFHRSWRKPEQRILLEKYLGAKIYSPEIYENFIKMTSPRLFLQEITPIVEMESPKKDLLIYNLKIALKPYIGLEDIDSFIRNFLDN